MWRQIVKKNDKTVISPNLISPEEKDFICIDVIGDTIKRILLVSLISLVVFWLVGGVLFLRIQQEEKTVAGKAQEIDPEKAKEINSISRELKETKTLESKVVSYIKNSYSWSQFLAELDKNIPQGVIINKIEPNTAKPGWMVLRGVAKERTNFLDLKSNLEKSNLCEKVESPISNIVSAQSFEFEVNILLRDWKPIWAKKYPAPKNQDQPLS